MLMSMREQTVDIGIMKAQGFTDGAMFRLLIAQALFLCVFGGSLGMLMAWATEGPVGALLGTNFPGFAIATETYLFAGLVTLGLGVLAGVVPAWRARQLRCVDAMRGTD
jgi:putative ABC transport system permease protein